MTTNKKILKELIVYICMLFLVTLLWLIPLLLLYVTNGTILSIWRSGLLSLSISAIILLLSKNWLRVLLSSFMILSTIVEIVMVKQFGTFLTYSHMMVCFGTNVAEATNFMSSNLNVLYLVIPYLLISIAVVWFICKHRVNKEMRVFTPILFFSLILSLISVKSLVDNKTWKDTAQEMMINRIPLNFWENLYATVSTIISIHQAETMVFGATRSVEIAEHEVVVLAIGESVRYANFSMNGNYRRETTPRLSSNQNAILFTDYATTACITMQAVPMILTRATPERFEMTYKESGIQQVFSEVGFYVVALKNNLIGDRLHQHLLNGANEVITISHDSLIPNLIDSLQYKHNKLFVYFQMNGSHAYYGNYTDDFNRFRPNIHSDKNVESDSLLLNAYDNTICYTDYLLCEMLKNINRGGVNFLLYVSDHGETITSTNGWHGAICDENEIHVPLVIWLSDEYKILNEGKWRNLQKNKDIACNTNDIFFTMCGLANIVLPKNKDNMQCDLSSNEYVPHSRTILHWTGKKTILWRK